MSLVRNETRKGGHQWAVTVTASIPSLLTATLAAVEGWWPVTRSAAHTELSATVATCNRRQQGAVTPDPRSVHGQ